MTASAGPQVVAPAAGDRLRGILISVSHTSVNELLSARIG